MHPWLITAAFLRGRAPKLFPSPQVPVPGEIAVAFGSRQISKLVDALQLEPSLSGEELERCLRLLLGLLSSQEAKAVAVRDAGVAPALTALLGNDKLPPLVRQLAVSCLGSLVSLNAGRHALVSCRGVCVLTAALAFPEALDLAVNALHVRRTNIAAEVLHSHIL